MSQEIPYIFRGEKDHPFIIEHSEPEFLLIHIKKGKIIVNIASKPITFEKGSYILISPDCLARMNMIPDFKLKFITIRVRIPKNYISEYFVNSTTSLPVKTPIRETFTKLKPNPFLEAFIVSLDIILKSEVEPTEELIRIKLQECIQAILASGVSMYEYLYNTRIETKRNLRDFMNENYIYNVPMERLAELSGRSLSTFRRDFIKEFNVNPSQWLMEKRLEFAYSLLAEKKMKPSEVYLDSGFETLAHFSRSFKTKYGFPPSKIKNIILTNSK